MLRSIKELYGDRLGASDGEIGQVKDFYFDDQNWAIRYLVADTGSWLPGRQVLLSPYSLGRLDQAKEVLRVNLTRKQIEDSPPIESHKPVSRQSEEEYYRYFGWPYYWQGDALWGLSGFPILELPAKPPHEPSVCSSRRKEAHTSAPKEDQSLVTSAATVLGFKARMVSGNSLPGEPANVYGPQLERAEAHLRSTQAVNGYQLRTGNELTGHVCDFMMDAQSWAIGQLVVKTGHRLSGKEVLILTKQVDRISYDESTVFVNLTREAVEQSPAHHLAPRTV